MEVKLKRLLRTSYLSAARNLLGRIGLKYEKGIVYERSLNIEIPEVITKTHIDVNQVSIEEINSGKYQGIILASRDNPTTHRESLDRLRSGDVCLIAKVDDTILGYSWLYFRRSKYEETFDMELTLNDDEALMYDRVVFKEFRRSGVGNKLNEERLRYLRSKNYKKALVLIRVSNIPSIRSFERFGFEPIKYITIKRIFFVKRAGEHILR